jgi:hypothetical protein
MLAETFLEHFWFARRSTNGCLADRFRKARIVAMVIAKQCYFISEWCSQSTLRQVCFELITVIYSETKFKENLFL